MWGGGPGLSVCSEMGTAWPVGVGLPTHPQCREEGTKGPAPTSTPTCSGHAGPFSAQPQAGGEGRKAQKNTAAPGESTRQPLGSGRSWAGWVLLAAAAGDQTGMEGGRTALPCGAGLRPRPPPHPIPGMRRTADAFPDGRGCLGRAPGPMCHPAAV